jgi:hypothetical protein
MTYPQRKALPDDADPEVKALMKIASTHAVVVLDDGTEGRAMWYHRESKKMKIKTPGCYKLVPVDRIKEVR